VTGATVPLSPLLFLHKPDCSAGAALEYSVPVQVLQETSARMRKKISLVVPAILGLMAVGSRPALAAATAALCNSQLSASIPERSPNAPSGDAFMRQIQGKSADERELAILEQLLAGDIPAFLRHLQPVHLSASGAPGREDLVVCVCPDYLAIGSDEDFFLVPMRLATALTVARRFGFVLPTRKIVDDIYRQARTRLPPQPLPASDQMRSTAYYWAHNDLVAEQRAQELSVLGLLTAGDKKDLVLTNRLWTHPGRVAIYGWHRPDGIPIQPLSTVHGLRYADYSHGVRLVSQTAYVDGRARSMLDLLRNPRTAAGVSDEGPLRGVGSLLR